jgi:competence protein ComEC
VGQGLSVIAHTPHHLLLYDTGPGDGHSWSMARSSFMPAIRQTGLHSPDRVVVSHGDLDHAGGVHEIRQWFPQAEVLTSKPQASQHQRACLAPRQWSWEGYRFEILHPGPGLPYLGNDSSCVLAIYGERPLVLLSGDIGASIEARLVDRGLSRFDVLAVPHHGSRSSSSPEFLEAVYPRLSLVSAGHRNRFGFPDSLVAGRYRSLGSTLLSTADCGGIEVRFDRNGFYRARSARRARPAVWRWPAAEHCP